MLKSHNSHMLSSLRVFLIKIHCRYKVKLGVQNKLAFVALDLIIHEGEREA